MFMPPPGGMPPGGATFLTSPGPLPPGATLVVEGQIPAQAQEFIIRLEVDMGTAPLFLRFQPQANGLMVCNSYIQGQPQEAVSLNTPLLPATHAIIKVAMDLEGYQITISGHQCHVHPHPRGMPMPHMAVIEKELQVSQARFEKDGQTLPSSPHPPGPPPGPRPPAPIVFASPPPPRPLAQPPGFFGPPGGMPMPPPGPPRPPGPPGPPGVYVPPAPGYSPGAAAPGYRPVLAPPRTGSHSSVTGSSCSTGSTYGTHKSKSKNKKKDKKDKKKKKKK